MRFIYFTAFMVMTAVSGCQEKSDQKENQKETPKTAKVDQIKPKTDLHKVSERCIETVFDIIESSKEFKELSEGLEERIRENGGTGYGFTVEVSPNPVTDQAFTKGDFYEISLHESYEDRMPNIAHFRFDHHQKKLFMMNVVNADYEEIGFDENLVESFVLQCSE